MNIDMVQVAAAEEVAFLEHQREKWKLGIFLTNGRPITMEKATEKKNVPLVTTQRNDEHAPACASHTSNAHTQRKSARNN